MVTGPVHGALWVDICSPLTKSRLPIPIPTRKRRAKIWLENMLKIENPNAKNQIIKGQPLSRQKPCKNQPKSTEEPHGSPTNVPVSPEILTGQLSWCARICSSRPDANIQHKPCKSTKIYRAAAAEPNHRTQIQWKYSAYQNLQRNRYREIQSVKSTKSAESPPRRTKYKRNPRGVENPNAKAKTRYTNPPKSTAATEPNHRTQNTNKIQSAKTGTQIRSKYSP